MAGLSKLLDIGKVDYNCYELGHTWSPNCPRAIFMFGSAVCKEAIKLYTAFYLANFIIRRQKITKENVKKLLLSILQSTVFLGTTGFVYLLATCVLRYALGNFNNVTSAYLPGFISSLAAILVERENRRSSLFLYVSNVATETLFRMLVFRKVIRPLPHGEVLLFSGAMALYMYNLKKYGCRDILATILRYLMNSTEKAEQNDNHYSYKNGSAQQNVLETPIKPVSLTSSVYKFWLSKLSKLRRLPRHTCCPHNNSCIYYCLSGYAKPFLFGTVIGTATLLPRMIKNPKSLLKEVLDIRKIRLGLFLGGFVGLYKTTSCILRWTYEKDFNWHAIPAGFIAGISMHFYRNSTISLYVVWKMIEIYYRIGMKTGYLPEIQGAIVLFYALSTALLFHAAVIEPHNLKPTYYKFLTRMTRGLTNQVNRRLTDDLGMCSSVMFPDYCPQLDERFMTPHGIESMKKMFPNF